MSNQEIAKYKDRKAEVIKDKDFNKNKEGALTKLERLIKKLIGVQKAQKFLEAKDKTQDAKKWLTFLEKDVKKKNYNGNKNTNDTLQMLLDEYIKVTSLEPMNIAGVENSNSYCSIEAEAGGVTAKVSLVNKDDTVKRLTNIAACQSPEDYKKIQKDTFKLTGIIKLPKHGDILEVQREAIALEIARKLKLDNTKVTESTMVDFQGKPALFVPFGNITLLKDIAKGEQQKQDLGLTGKTYQHYSTLNPVGEGIQPNTIVNDFGNTLAYFYLCGDPDAIGKDNQNKAVTKGDKPNQLYLFDQVVMPNTRMKIDSRLKIQPTGFLRHSRHFQFRNRSLIEDNDFDARFNSLEKLTSKKGDINKIFKQISEYYDTKIDKIKEKRSFFQKVFPFTAKDQKELKQYKKLQKDAKKLQKVLNKRIDALNDVLPKLQIPKNNQKLKDDKSAIKKGAVILETLLNKPTLYSNEGRPYRTPYTYRNKLSIKNIKIENDTATIKFNGKIDKEWYRHIGECHGKKGEMNMQIDQNRLDVIKIPVEKLKEIQFEKVFPELEKSSNYGGDLSNESLLDVNSLGKLKGNYDKDNTNDDVLDEIKDFNKKFFSANNDEKKAKLLQETRKKLDGLRKYAKNKGFINHVLRRFDLVAQQRLLSMMNDVSLNNAMKKACEAAVKLDQVNALNELCQNAINYGFNSDQNKEGYDEFKDILEEFKNKADSNIEKSCNDGISLKETYDEIFIGYQKKIEDKRLYSDNKKLYAINNNNKKKQPVLKQKADVSDSCSNNNNVDNSNQPSIDTFKNMSKVNALLNQYLIDGAGSKNDYAIVSNKGLNKNISRFEPLPVLIKSVNDEAFNQKNERHSKAVLVI